MTKCGKSNFGTYRRFTGERNILGIGQCQIIRVRITGFYMQGRRMGTERCRRIDDIQQFVGIGTGY